ncbi:MAG TPA: hypothetical protein DCO82_05540 [Alphaproteobacteria bacterium]|nr:hypothetical protein [Alphaproteobacteria bacterium]
MHPHWLLDSEDYALLNIYADYAAEFGGHLPFSGGSAEQPACVMDCLRVIHNALPLIKKDTTPGG